MRSAYKHFVGFWCFRNSLVLGQRQLWRGETSSSHSAFENCLGLNPVNLVLLFSSLCSINQFDCSCYTAYSKLFDFYSEVSKSNITVNLNCKTLLGFLNPLAIHFDHESIENVVIMIWLLRIIKKPCGVESLEKNWNWLILFLSRWPRVEEGFWGFGFSMDLVKL